MKIGLYMGAWPTNIGNAFFDLGARASLLKAFPDSDIIPLGGATHWMFNASRKNNENKLSTLVKKFMPDKYYERNSFEIGEYAKVDIIVFAGMSMCSEFVHNNGHTFLRAAKRGIPILGLGTGASLYTHEEAQCFSDFLSQLHRYYIISRDELTYDLFSSHIKNIWSGIDSAFFLPDYFTPPLLEIDSYNIECFDSKGIVPSIQHTSDLVLHTHHDLWGPLPESYINTPYTLVSDVPEDYLTLYSQVNETHSDRVHACIATLAYGNMAKLYNDTKRGSLFEKVKAFSIREKPTKIDLKYLDVLKTKQVQKIQQTFEMLL